MDDEWNWDRTHDWVIHRIHRNQVRISVVLSESDRTRELAAIRSISEKHRHARPTQLKDEVVEGKFLLGVFGSIECQRIRREAATLGLKLDLTDISSDGFLPEDKTAGLVWLIEDDSKAKRVAQEMTDAGVPIEITEAD